MKQTIIMLLLLWPVTALFSQEVFQPGIVKGKNVTYHVSIGRVVSFNIYIKNMANDTTVRFMGYNNDWLNDSIPMKQSERGSTIAISSGRVSLNSSLREELEWQLAEIFHEHLSPKDLQLLKKTKDRITICVRINPENHVHLEQVTYFCAPNAYLAGLKYPTLKDIFPESYEGFWLNFDPDKLYEIEKDIVKQIRVPEGVYEVESTGDFLLTLNWDQIYDPKKPKKNTEKKNFRNGVKSSKRYILK